MRVAYKIFPLDKSDPTSLGRTETWMPFLVTKIVVGHAQSRTFEAVVDSGSDICLFHAEIGAACGLKLTAGVEGSLGGVISGAVKKVYYHQIKIGVAGTFIPVVAGFSPDLSVAGLLGRYGFFDSFNVCFDPCNNPPGFELARIYRA